MFFSWRKLRSDYDEVVDFWDYSGCSDIDEEDDGLLHDPDFADSGTAWLSDEPKERAIQIAAQRALRRAAEEEQVLYFSLTLIFRGQKESERGFLSLGDMVPRAQKRLAEKWGNDSEWSVPRVYLLSILAAYTGAVGSTRVRMSKPLLLPEPYGGEAGGWAEWVDHFENVATVNKWGHCKRQLYVAELSARTRHKDEDWATFGDVLRVLADKAYPDLEEKARETSCIKPKRPTNVEEAVVATIELESYLGSSGKPLRVSAVSPQEPDPDVRVRRADRAEAVAAVSPLDEPQTVKLLASATTVGDATRETREFHKASDNKTTTEQGVATVGLVLKEKTVVPAGSEMEVMVKIAGPVTNGTWFVGHKSATCNGVMVANAVVSPSSNVVPVRILNPRDEMVVLKKGTQIASMELLEQDPVINISTVMKNAEVSLECQNILWDLVSKVGSHISESEREQLYSLLVEFADVFSFSSKDLGRTKELKHHIFTSDAQPVHLSPRRIPQARREELRGLLRDMLESDSLHTQIMSDVSYSTRMQVMLELVLCFHRQCGRDEDIESENTVMVGVVSNPFQKYTPAEMRQMQLDDTTIQPVHCANSSTATRDDSFESDLVKEICELLQIRKTRTTPYHPQCNGMVERFNRTLLDMLSTAVGNHQADWQQHIRKLCLAYNSSVHSSTGFTPFFLMFGMRQAKLTDRPDLFLVVDPESYTILGKEPFKVMERLSETTYKIKNLQENTGSREQEPVGTNLDLVDSDDDDPVQQEEAAVPEIASPPVPPLNEQRRYPRAR
eukprot:Em0384g2a